MVKGDNSVNTQCRIVIRVHCPSSYCHKAIHQVSFKSH